MRKSHLLLLILKVCYCFYGVFIFGKITYLGDSVTYLNSPITLSMATLRNNTLLITTITAILKKVLFLDILVHLAFCLFSFWGLVILIKELKWSIYKEYILVFFLCLPSFGMWTSVICKEAFTCFFTCIGNHVPQRINDQRVPIVAVFGVMTNTIDRNDKSLILNRAGLD